MLLEIVGALCGKSGGKVLHAKPDRHVCCGGVLASIARKVEYFGSQADVESHKSFIPGGTVRLVTLHAETRLRMYPFQAERRIRAETAHAETSGMPILSGHVGEAVFTQTQ